MIEYLEHLLPVQPCGHQLIDEYRATVSKILQLDQRADPDIVGSAMCMPSFDPEWVLHFRRSRDGRCSVELTIAAANIWFTKSADPTIRYRSEIPPDVLREIDAVWSFILQNTQASDNAETGLDGARYHFYRHTNNDALQAGQTWSPYPHTVPGRAVALLHALHEFTVCRSDSHVRQLLRSWWLLRKIARTTRWFRKHDRTSGGVILA